VAFIERHRTLLNAYIAAQPSTIEGAFAPLLATPRLLDFANKAKHFRAHMRRLRAEMRGSLPLSLRRRSTFEESFRQLKGKSAEEMRAPLNVKFHGEEAIDAGAMPQRCLPLPVTLSAPSARTACPQDGMLAWCASCLARPMDPPGHALTHPGWQCRWRDTGVV
jgi:hypothetical protein